MYPPEHRMQDIPVPSREAIDSGESLLKYLGTLEGVGKSQNDDKAALRKWVKDAKAAAELEANAGKGGKTAPAKTH